MVMFTKEGRELKEFGAETEAELDPVVQLLCLEDWDKSKAELLESDKKRAGKLSTLMETVG